MLSTRFDADMIAARASGASRQTIRSLLQALPGGRVAGF